MERFFVQCDKMFKLLGGFMEIYWIDIKGVTRTFIGPKGRFFAKNNVLRTSWHYFVKFPIISGIVTKNFWVM